MSPTLEAAQEACRLATWCAAGLGAAVAALFAVAFCLVDNWLQERRARREFATWLEAHRSCDPYRERG